MTPFERSVTDDEARGLIADLLADIAKAKRLTFHHYKKNNIDVVYVKDPTGRELAYGLGKGDASYLGAHGECLEHLFYADIGRQGAEIVPVEQLNSSILAHDAFLRHAYTLPGAEPAPHCVPFQYVGSEGVVFLPRMYVNYHLLDGDKSDDTWSPFKTFIGRYATTSGVAFGLTADDAFLHALNETIERDATSEFLIDMTQEDYAVKNEFMRLDADTLPEHLRGELDDATTRFRPARVALYICRTFFGPWWSFCVFHFDSTSRFVLPQWGAGASLLYDLALSRSISECVQMMAAYEAWNSQDNLALKRFVETYPRLRAVAEFDEEDRYSLVPYNNKHNAKRRSVAEQVTEITSNMIDRGYRPAKHEIQIGRNGWIVTAYTAGLERFYNITKAVPVLPLRFVEEHANRMRGAS